MAEAESSYPEEKHPASSSNAPSGHGAAGRGAALKESMRQLLKKKSGNPQASADAPPSMPSNFSPAVSSNASGKASGPEGAAAANGYPASVTASSQPPAHKERAQVLREALRSAPAARGEALKSSMRKLLTAKGSGGIAANPSTVFDAVFEHEGVVGPTAGCAEASTASRAPPEESGEKEDEDPWPEVRLSHTILGIEDGQNRAIELARRGDFSAAFQMWSKVRFVARQCRKPLSESKIAEIEAAWVAAKADVPPPLPALDPEPIDALPSVASATSSLLTPSSQPLESQPLPAAPSDAVPQSKPQTAPVAAMSRPEPAPAVGSSSASGTHSVSRASERAAMRERAAVAADSACRASDQASSGQAEVDPNDWNSVFYDKMEKDYDKLCAADGWDSIREGQQDFDGWLCKPNVSSRQDAIPADSDYFRVELPDGAAARELRCGPDARASMPELPKANRPPRRNLDELRRVEAATQAALDKERVQRANSATRSSPPSVAEGVHDDEVYRPPITCKSDVVHIDSLSVTDDSDTDKEDWRSSKNFKNAESTFKALEEFEKLGREKEERLAKWKDRWG